MARLSHVVWRVKDFRAPISSLRCFEGMIRLRQKWCFDRMEIIIYKRMYPGEGNKWLGPRAAYHPRQCMDRGESVPAVSCRLNIASGACSGSPNAFAYRSIAFNPRHEYHLSELRA